MPMPPTTSSAFAAGSPINSHTPTGTGHRVSIGILACGNTNQGAVIMSQKMTHANPTAFCHAGVLADPEAEDVPARLRHSISTTSSTNIPIAEKMKNSMDGDSASVMPRYRSITTCMSPEHRNANSVLTALSIYVDFCRPSTSLARKLLMDESGHRGS